MRKLLIVLLLVAANALGVEVRAVRTATPPRIDGDLSDPAWQAAPPITNFTQHDPDDGKPATQPTTVRLLFDDNALYVAADMRDSQPPDTRLARRDSAINTDVFGILLDPRHDRRTGVGFYVSAAGEQIDEVIYNDSYEDMEWDAVWSSATRVNANGWTAELRIPFSQLRFPSKPVQVWGVNLQRFRLRNNEEDRLVNTPKNETGYVSRFADLVGLDDISPRRDLELLPYGVVRNDVNGTIERNDPLNSRHASHASAGLDAKYRLGSDLTLTGTINPDFGQVEVDPAVVNLTQFEQFYPEKRPFFTEGTSLFAFGQGASNNNANFNFFEPNLFYTRRIGREPQDTGNLDGLFTTAPSQTTILGAAKLTGRTESGWSLGVIDAVTNRERGFAIDGNGAMRSQLVEPMTNYFVFRPSKDIGADSRIGFLLTSVHRKLTPELQDLRRDAWTAGVDGYSFFHHHDWIVQWMLAATRVEGSAEAIAATQNEPAHQFARPDARTLRYDPTRTSLNGFGGRVVVAKQTGKWLWNAKAETYSPGFDVNDIGFMQRVDETATHLTVFYNNNDQTKLFRRRTMWIAKWQHFNYDGNLISNGVGINIQPTLRNYVSPFVHVMKGFRHPDDRSTRGGPRIIEAPDLYEQIGVTTNPNSKWVFTASATRYASDNGTLARNLTLQIDVRPTRKLFLSIAPSYDQNREGIQYVTTVADPLATRTYGNRYVFATMHQRQLNLPMRVDWTFSPTLSFQLYAQPLISAGDYGGFKELNRPLSLDWRVYGSEIAYNAAANSYTVDPGSGEQPFTFDNPSFDLRTLRGSAVLRWEFRPGSALYVAWNENRNDTLPTGAFRFARDARGILRAPSNDVFMIKIAYWLPM